MKRSNLFDWFELSADTIWSKNADSISNGLFVAKRIQASSIEDRELFFGKAFYKRGFISNKKVLNEKFWKKGFDWTSMIEVQSWQSGDRFRIESDWQTERSIERNARDVRPLEWSVFWMIWANFDQTLWSLQAILWLSDQAREGKASSHRQLTISYRSSPDSRVCSLLSNPNFEIFNFIKRRLESPGSGAFHRCECHPLSGNPVRCTYLYLAPYWNLSGTSIVEVLRCISKIIWRSYSEVHIINHRRWSHGSALGILV